MHPLAYVLIALLVIGALWGLKIHLRNKRRKRLFSQPFPEEWKEHLAKHVYLYRHLPDELKAELHGDILIFLDEKRFEGCEGFQVNDEVRVTIAAEASLLLLRKKSHYYPRLKSILVYPGAYMARQKKEMGLGAAVEDVSVRAGESWGVGTLILAWDYVERSAKNPRNGHNVVLHEFAHQLDTEYGPADGLPELHRRTQYAEWARVLGHEYEELKKNAAKHKKSLLDDYGATNPAEFFAVATETFFGKPRQMKKKEPELYEELRKYYLLDPAEWG